MRTEAVATPAVTSVVVLVGVVVVVAVAGDDNDDTADDDDGVVVAVAVVPVSPFVSISADTSLKIPIVAFAGVRCDADRPSIELLPVAP